MKRKNELTFDQITALRANGYQYYRFDNDGVLSGSNDKKNWKKVEIPDVPTEGGGSMVFYSHQVFDAIGILT